VRRRQGNATIDVDDATQRQHSFRGVRAEFLELTSHFAGGRIPLHRILLQQARHDGFEARINVHTRRRQRRSFRVNHSKCRGDSRRCTERSRPCEQFVEQHADGEEITSTIDRRIARGLLGREIVWRAKHHAGACSRRWTTRIDHLRNAEIEQSNDGLTASGIERDEHVLRLEITMNDAHAMSRIERFEDRYDRRHRGIEIETTETLK
jgi:hypothetical protein